MNWGEPKLPGMPMRKANPRAVGEAEAASP
jgi:hypothetical protein